MAFLPVNQEDIAQLGWDGVDFVLVTGDAYVDHPSFGTAVISRVLEAEGFRVAVLPQPDWRDDNMFLQFGKPRLGFLVNSGNIDSMVAHYTASKKRRNDDYYTAGKIPGKRPDRAVIVYCNIIRRLFPDSPVIIGGIEASTRRFAHYDYWDDRVRASILVDSGADILSYGMGEHSIKRIANLLSRGIPVRKIRDVRGTCYMCGANDKINFEAVEAYDFDILKNDKSAYARAFLIQYQNQDHHYGKAIIERYGERKLVQNPPQPPLTTAELDFVYSLPFERQYHPQYIKDGGISAIEEVKFSITHTRGCFGACNFCALSFHQGRAVTSRSIASVVREAEIIAAMPDFKGYIHDIGGPTANFRHNACGKQKESGVCADKKCLVPTPCKNLTADHSEYIELLNRVAAVKGVKKVFIRSGIRFDYLLADPKNDFFKKLVREHISGQLKVAPEHCSENVLSHMGKPSFEIYKKFAKRFYDLTKGMNKEQYIVPYLMSSHPGSRLSDAIELAVYLRANKINPEQVQDFYPTPGTASTCMFHTGLDPFTGKEVFVEKTNEGKRLQRAMLQFYKKENAPLIRKALRACHREDLIGRTKQSLVPPESDGVIYRSRKK